MFEFILDNDITICNRDSEPTFITSVRQEVIGITLSIGESLKVADWRVSQECSFSDHARIHFSIDIGNSARKPFRDPKKTDWAGFSVIVADRHGSPRGSY